MADPEILRKTAETVAEEINRKIPAYTPEWTPSGEGDPGTALVRIYADLADIAIRRLNMAPRRHFLAFLEALNITLHPSRPARVPLTFLLSDGTPEPVLIPASTLASAQGIDGRPVMFQTEENLLATPSRMVAMYSVTKVQTGEIPPVSIDDIYDHSIAIDGKGRTSLFTSQPDPPVDNLQEHALYIGDSNLFNVKSGKEITLSISGRSLSLAAGSVEWSYLKEIEEVVQGKKKKTIIPMPFSSSDPHFGNTVTLTLKEGETIEEIEFPEILPKVKSRWITCKVHPGSIHAVRGATITDIRVPAANNPIRPDFSYYNDVPLDVRNCSTTPVYPFGKKPQPNDSWYLACEKAFSRKGASIEIQLTFSRGISSAWPDSKPLLSWEYWDGEGWQILGNTKFLTARNTALSQSPTFCETDVSQIKICIATFPELKKTRIGGRENYWIRVRLIGGDYGKEYTISYDETTKTFKFYPPDTPSYHPPTITNITISYGVGGDLPVDYIVTRNNLQVQPWSPVSVPPKELQPFQPLSDDHPALYLGFDRELPRGETSIFIAQDETNEYPDSYRPKISWQVLAADRKWKEIISVDETRGFTRSGMVRLFVPEKMSGAMLFGSQTDRFWIRGVNTTDEFCTAGSGSGTTVPGNASPSTFDSECRGTFALMNTSLVKETYRSTLPTITGMYLNSVWATQSRSISDEIAGSGTGEQSQAFSLLFTPVIHETVWVDELTALAENERKVLESQKIADIKTDEKGKVLGFWVRWEAVDDLVNSRPQDRHYTIDRTFGVITFGDGKNGRIPPIGRNNIRISYTTGGGIAGNFPASSIVKVHSAVAFVYKVTNMRPSLGGTDTESVDALILRAPPSLKNRGRAVTAEDYELLALESSPEVARAKALQNVRLPRTGEDPPALGYKVETGYVTVVIVPKSSEAKPVPSRSLISSVQDSLEKCCPNVVTLAVIRPSYVSVNVKAEIFTTRMDAVPVIERIAKQTIAGFLHPLSGNTHGKGWAFGTVPCLSDLYAVLEDIDDVEYVKNVVMNLTGDNDAQVAEITEASGVISLPVYALVYPGECSITANLVEGGEER